MKYILIVIMVSFAMCISTACSGLGNKTKKVNEFKDILDIMLSMSKQDASFSGTDENFDTKSRIIEKIK